MIRPVDDLIDGYRRFRADTWPAKHARYETLATRGQQPGTLVISCSDLRVDSQTMFGVRVLGLARGRRARFWSRTRRSKPGISSSLGCASRDPSCRHP